jgi:iron-sulfur cluster repair protein YtfE (RIC family)
MLTHIGTTRPADDLTALLLECHGRIRSFVALAGALASGEGSHPEDVADTAARVARYFGEALALHAEDEEASILPRLAGKDRDVDAALVTMHRDHARHGPAVDRVVALCTLLAAEPSRRAELAPALTAAVRALDGHFASHLASEEEIVFPAVRRYLSARAQGDVVRELRSRRAAAAAARAEAHSSR